ncbi:type II toxin-antitoxin system VapC family toxin [Sphingomonas sp. 1P08PE]|uniref:type II toxin-antitoxin system VapC family toxin n=1 Tax=Sphingomonas sp. 1P08PE TaxID=554122 RepID=UPI0039A38577
MILFVDASAMVAIMTDEADAFPLEERFGAAHERLSSPVALWETARAIARKRKIALDLAFGEVKTFVADFDVRLVPLGEHEASAAILAQARYGKGTSHPAQLNMGDCFAYACAKTNDAHLLYKGDDFLHTDMA